MVLSTLPLSLRLLYALSPLSLSFCLSRRASLRWNALARNRKRARVCMATLQYIHTYSHIYLSSAVTSGDRYRVPLICHEVERLLLSRSPTEPPRSPRPLCLVFHPLGVSDVSLHPSPSLSLALSLPLVLAVAALTIFLPTLEE